MDVQISGRHFHVTEAIRGHVQKHLEKLARHDEKIHSLSVTLALDAGVQHAEVVARCHNSTLVAEAKNHDMYVSIDRAFAKMERQVARLHDRRRTHGSHSG